jgi:ABC-type transporter Mla subunit MlaD
MREGSRDRGARGFFLGLLALILIAAVVGMYGWTAWLSAGMRDTISGWFGFMS